MQKTPPKKKRGRYRADCKNCSIDSRRSLAAFLASDAYGAFNRQAAARKLLAGLYRWPEGSPATTIAESKSGDLEVRCDRHREVGCEKEEEKKEKKGKEGGCGMARKKREEKEEKEKKKKEALRATGGDR